jgi:hypothetical protein
VELSVIDNGESCIAVVRSADVVIADGQSALDLIATVMHETGCDKIVIEKSVMAEDFFDLSTRVAGEVLQKFVNYQMKLAIVGDFSGYASKSLYALILESNKGSDAFFLPTEEMAVAKLQDL